MLPGRSPMKRTKKVKRAEPNTERKQKKTEQMQYIIMYNIHGHFNQISWLAAAGSIQAETELSNKQKHFFLEKH